MTNEKRLIDAKGKFVLNAGDLSGHIMCFENGYATVFDRFAKVICKFSILEAPTVDAVEVVRCKDCRWARMKDHREPTDTPRELICQCFKHHYIPAPWGARMAVNPDDFCSYGERKDNGSHKKKAD